MFKVGDVVLVSENPVCETFGFTEEMDKYKGNIYEVSIVNPDGYIGTYHLRECGDWYFDEAWLTLVGRAVEYKDISEKEIENMFT